MAANVEVYTGFWTNWSGGAIAGSTLTLNLQQGAYLVAFLALYVRLVGTYMWQLISYFIFQVKASSSDADILNAHHLLVLRNVTTDFTAMCRLAKAAWKDRNHSKRVAARSVLLILAAAVHGVAFTAAGILASRVTNAKSNVLLRSKVCGTWYPGYGVSPFGLDIETMKYQSSLEEDAVKSTQFVAECYNDTSLASCNTYGRRLLDYTTSIHSACPFDNMCTNHTVVRVDSGFVDSLYDLGINSHPSNRIAFRKVTECAPLTTDGFTRRYTSQDLSDEIDDIFKDYQSTSGSYYTAFYYGKSLDEGVRPTFVFDNSSFDVSSDSIPAPFYIDTEFSFPNTTPSYYSTFQAIPPLSQSTGSVVLLFLAKGVSYASPVLDPWFQADLPTPPTPQYGVNYTSYESVPRVSVLGCTTNTQVCNPVGGNNCLPFMPETEAKTMSNRLNFNTAQTGILKRFQSTLLLDVDFVFESIGGQGLLAYENIAGNLSPGMPDNQWILEVQHAFSVLLNFQQLHFTRYVIGQETVANNKYAQPPNANEQWMCSNQIVQRNDYASFSVLGLCIILIVGGAIMVLNLLLRSLRVRMFLWGQHRSTLWRSHELLELRLQTTPTEMLGLQPRPAEGWTMTENEDFQQPSPISSSSTSNNTMLTTIKAFGSKSWKSQETYPYSEVKRESELF